MPPLIECIPNFSEGRDPAIIEALVTSIWDVLDVQLLHVTSDADHNRTVITFAGPPDAVQKAAFAAIKVASERIDMTQHQGVHPRIGAADVVPFVPLNGASMQDCVTLAQNLGVQVGSELGIPVYLYAEAATKHERRNLANIRRNEYEGLKNNIQQKDRQPDFGPPALGSAGAVAIGARPPLIAYNVYLNTNDVSIAKNIARAIRGSSGGLVGVKALGLFVNRRAQVSMNLTDYKRTPLHRVMMLIHSEAARYGTQILTSELIGLIPQDALIDAALWHLQLPADTHAQILETRLSDS